MNDANWGTMPKPGSKVLDVLVLEIDEKVLTRWKGTVETFEKSVVTKGRIRKKHKIVEARGKEDGLLILTSRRLLWVNKKGRVGKTYRVTYEIPFEGIRSISGGGAVRKFISLIDSEDEYWFRLSGKYSSLEFFRPLLRSVMDAREKEIESEKKKARVHVMIDFSSLADHMKEGGLVLQTVKCTECGGPLKLPESGNEIICEHCGCTVHAQDIFEKIESLIG